jgi:hypothetical protein
VSSDGERGGRAGLGPSWRVRRTGGLLVPGFSKRFDLVADEGTTYLAGVPIGRFDVRRRPDGAVELDYRRWPVVDVVGQAPVGDGSIDSSGYVRLPGAGRRLRFCRFRLER